MNYRYTGTLVVALALNLMLPAHMVVAAAPENRKTDFPGNVIDTFNSHGYHLLFIAALCKNNSGLSATSDATKIALAEQANAFIVTGWAFTTLVVELLLKPLAGIMRLR